MEKKNGTVNIFETSQVTRLNVPPAPCHGPNTWQRVGGGVTRHLCQVGDVAPVPDVFGGCMSSLTDTGVLPVLVAESS